MITEKGTAVAVYSNDRGTILVTCKHVIERNPDSVWICYDGGDWVQCSNVLQHPTEDIAAMECPIQVKATAMTDDIPVGSEVVVDGAGPAVRRSNESWFFRGKTTEDGIVGNDGLAVITGDSGGPVYVKTGRTYAVGGIAWGYPGDYSTERRADHRGHNAVTLYTPCRAFIPWIQTQYCPQGNCPIQIRPQVIQPLGPLGFPRGPARVIGIAEPVPQQYVPAQPIRSAVRSRGLCERMAGQQHRPHPWTSWASRTCWATGVGG
jgi:hypothetical protein